MPQPGAVTGAVGGNGSRNQRIDALKCFAIGMVVLTHVLNLRWEFKSLAPWLVDAMLAFNMPLFALLAGYVHFGRDRGGVRLIANKARALLVPYLAWIALVMPLRRLPASDWLPRAALALIDPHAGFQMWFLWSLFWVFVVFTVTRATPWPDVVAGGLALAAAAVWLGTPSKAFGFDKVAWLYLFFVLGYFTAKYRVHVRKWEWVVQALGVASFPLFVSFGLVREYPLFAGLSGVAASLALYSVQPAVLLRPQARVGRRSLGIYGAQMIVLPFCIVGAGWGGAALSWTAAFVGSLVVTLVLERWAVTRAVFLGMWPRRRRATVDSRAGI